MISSPTIQLYKSAGCGWRVSHAHGKTAGEEVSVRWGFVGWLPMLMIWLIATGAKAGFPMMLWVNNMVACENKDDLSYVLRYAGRIV
jgi:hypothetical protein